MSKVTFLYHPINENKINLVQSFAKVWYEDDPQIPVYALIYFKANMPLINQV